MERGSLVECIDDNFGERAYRMLKYLPKKGALYLVRRIVNDKRFSHQEIGGVMLEELVNPKCWFWSEVDQRNYLIEPRFYPWRFREVQPPMEIEEVLNEEREGCFVG